jgi:hypothetical protein
VYPEFGSIQSDNCCTACTEIYLTFSARLYSLAAHVPDKQPSSIRMCLHVAVLRAVVHSGFSGYFISILR